MTTVCLKCGERISSRLDFIEGIKTIRHLNKHPNLKELFHTNQERVTEAVTLEDGSTLHLIGDMVSFETEEGGKEIRVDELVN
jgi:uncharacterized pyridoxamine 5'-phosphate oxidase family protein